MAYAPEAQVWVKCDDGEWWPAKTKPVTPDLRPFMDESEDCCVEFYHDVGQLYPVCSTDPLTVQPLHRVESTRTAQEQLWFHRPATRAAVARALQDASTAPHHEVPTPTRGSTTFTRSPLRTGSTSSTAVTNAPDLRHIPELLGAMSEATAALMRSELASAGVGLSSARAHRSEAEERARRKRTRTPTSTVMQQGRPVGLAGAPGADTSGRAHAGRRSDVKVNRPRQRLRYDDDGGGGLWSSDTSSDGGGSSSSSQARGGRDGPSSDHRDHEGRSDGDSRYEEEEASAASQQEGFVPPVDSDTLEVLRAEVFENPMKFVLSPVYRFLDLLGAVTVENATVRTTLPSPRAVRHAPDGGFAASRRVLLVALTEDYSHTSGWMQPVRLDDAVLGMRLSVNGTEVPVPSNWHLTPGKEATAIRTAPVADITDLVMAVSEDLFSLEVGFTTIPDDTDLWNGIVACVFAEEVSIATIGEQIVMNYRKGAQSSPSQYLGPARRRSTSREDGGVNITEGYVKLQCPLTTMLMEIPVRGVGCEHLQCVELAAVLIHCVRANLWNCPLCDASVKPRDVWVNYRLKDWIQGHQSLLRRVEYVMETPVGQPLKIQLKDTQEAEAVDVDDDDV